jgi:hypothetical protein
MAFFDCKRFQQKENGVMASILIPANQPTLQELVEQVMAKALAVGNPAHQGAGKSE